MDNPILEPSAIFYGKAESDASDSTTDETITETKADEAAPVEDQVDELETEESETAEDIKDENSDEDEELLYIDFDGEEVSFDQIKEWKSQGLMQADYTRKTQELSEQRTTFEADVAELANQSESLKTLAAQLEAVIGSEDEVDMNELREVDPDEYIKLTERNEKRQKLLNKAKDSFTATKPISDADVDVERQKLLKNNPQWVDKDNNPTEEYKSDLALLDTYLKNNGWTNEEFSIVYQAKHVEALVKAAKFDALKGKTDIIKKKVRKAPVVTKGKSKAKAKDDPGKSATDIFYPKKV